MVPFRVMHGISKYPNKLGIHASCSPGEMLRSESLDEVEKPPEFFHCTGLTALQDPHSPAPTPNSLNFLGGFFMSGPHVLTAWGRNRKML